MNLSNMVVAMAIFTLVTLSIAACASTATAPDIVQIEQVRRISFEATA